MTFRQIFSKITAQTAIGFLVAAVASAGFLLGSLSGDQYLVLATMAFMFFFKGGASSD